MNALRASLVLVAGLATPAAGVASDEQGVVLLERHESSLDTTGQVRAADVDSAGVSVAEPSALGSISETVVPTIPERPLKRTGTLDPLTFGQEVARHFADLESCRIKVAEAARVPLGAVAAGEISLHWTVLPSGGTRDTVVLEVSQTDLVLMKCVRRRMNAWTFSAPVGGPYRAHYDYTFLDAPTSTREAGPKP